jgi:hypothetical protein
MSLLSGVEAGDGAHGSHSQDGQVHQTSKEPRLKGMQECSNIGSRTEPDPGYGCQSQLLNSTGKPCRAILLPHGHESICIESFDLCTPQLMALDTLTSCILAPDAPSIDLVQWWRLFKDILFLQCKSGIWGLSEDRARITRNTLDPDIGSRR